MQKNQHIGLKILELRKNKKLSQESFVSGLGIERAALSLIENNKMSPSLDLITKIVNKYNVSFDFLLNEKNDYIYNVNTPIIEDKLPPMDEPPPDWCEKCYLRDKIIKSQEFTINAQQSTIHALEKRIEEITGEIGPQENGQKRKVG